MKTRKTAVITASVLLILFAAGIIMFVGSSRNLFTERDEARIMITSLRGQATVVRMGTGYSLKEDIGLEEDDEVYTSPGTEALFEVTGAGSFVMDGNSRVSVETDTDGLAVIRNVFGAVLYRISPEQGVLRVSSPAGVISSEAPAFFSVESYPGTQTIKVFFGELTLVTDPTSDAVRLFSGYQLTVVQNDDGISVFSEISGISIQSLSGFLLKKLEDAPDQDVFPPSVLTAEEERREKEMEDAMALREAYEASVMAQGGTVPVIETTSVTEYMTESDIHTCTISIVCYTLLDHMGDLAEGKNSFVPPNGIILAPSTVQFVSGETVYDILKRACSASGIPIQYSWTVEFGGYYVEGINNLCEFDCGPESGWMYSVNGWFPNYGSSNYLLSDRDIIVWHYTCEGLGRDLGYVWSP
ncbi:MAG: DUF4430 domain-containing protein [Eubacteriaceae bacterium]|nr:DUF4430 domain-containing protein [Eubacteriaceae bacterium]